MSGMGGGWRMAGERPGQGQTNPLDEQPHGANEWQAHGVRRQQSSPTPPFPAPGTITPNAPTPIPHNAPTPTPAGRLREARAPRSSAHPDGTPAPLPGGRQRTAVSRAPASRGASRVVQRFSGSGLTPERHVRSQERNARRATLTLAVVMALALVCSAVLLFDPSAFRSGFGLALGQRLSSLSSDIPLILSGTEPPTAPPTISSEPTATPHGGGAGAPTATPTTAIAPPTATTVPPTATPALPTPTPTPPIGKSATVTIKSVTQNKQTSGNLNGCPNGSGCNFADTWVNVGGHGVSSNWQGTWVNAYLQGTISFQTDNPNFGCGGCVVGYPYVSWNGTNCLENPYTVNIPKGGSYNATCTIPLYNPTSLSPNSIQGICYCQHFFDITWSNPNWFSGSHWQVMYGDCQAALANAQGKGKSWGDGVFSSQTSGQTVVNGPNVSYSNYNCNPGVGSWNQYFTGILNAAVSGLAYTPANAQQAALAQLQLDAGWQWLSRSSCSSVKTVSYSGSSVTVSCTATGTEEYVWTSSDKSSLANALAGQSQSSAQSICTKYAHVGTCTVTINGGTIMPSAANITITVT